MLSRRSLIGKLAAGVAVSVAGAHISSASTLGDGSRDPGDGSRHDDGRATSGPATAAAPWALLQPLTLGTEVAHGWRVTDLSEVIDGACVLTLTNEQGRLHRIHLCRNDGRPHGVVHTDRLDMVVMNGGQGDLPTDEGFGQAVAVVARVLAANEPQHAPQIAALLPHAERLRLFGTAVDAKLR